MTPKEAINDLKEFATASWGSTSDTFDMAIEALEKQIPKKPVSKYFPSDGYNVCPSCETECCRRILFRREKHCPECGQKILWEEEE